MSRGRLALEQPELDQALGDGAHRRLVRLVPVIAGTHLVDGGELRLEDDLVDGALRRREPAVHGKRARDVGGVVVVLAAGVEQQQVPVAQPLIVVAVMHDAGIGAAADDRMIGEVGVVRAELVQHLRHHLVFHAPGPREAHGAAVRADGDLRGSRLSLACSARLL